MSELREPDWMRTLGEIETAVQNCLAILDRYESTFFVLFANADPAARPKPALPPTPPVEVLSARITVAEREADAVERLLAEQESLWNDWQRRFKDWRQSLEQTAVSAANH